MISRKSAIVYTGKLTLVFVAFSLSCIAFMLTFTSCNAIPAVKSAALTKDVRIVLDAGHGGRDGGAVGVNGMYEKEVNLALTKAMAEVLRACGEEPMLTRESDTLLCNENDPALKGKIKMTDLKNRVKIADNYPEAVFISLHMNKFPQEKYSGLQGYYSPNHPNSQTLAESIQTRVCAVLQPNNHRKVKAAGSNIYLLDRITSPAVLIECGFLSNAEECEKLCDEKYRSSLALVLADCTLAILR